MIYIIISNVGLALMMIIVYGRYSKFRISTASEIRDLQKKIEKEHEEKRVLDEKLLNASKDGNEKVEALLREIDGLRKEKESEIKLRLEAEKQIELALQRTEEIQKRMQDWRLVQDAVMKDSKDAIVRMGNDLFKKMSDNYKIEVETNKNLIGRVSKNISDFVDKFSAMKPAIPAASGGQQVIAKATESSPAPAMDELTKKLIADLVSTMKASGRLVNKDYFLPGNFDEQKAKLMLCEVAFIVSNRLYIIDFKACRYLQEYGVASLKDKVAAENTLKQKLDKYFLYLANPKYRESILKVMASTKSKFDKSYITIIVPSKTELQVMKQIRYYEKAHQSGFEVLDFDGINNLVL
jgi:cell division protein FtsL